jgi:hypothetical protein
MHRHLALAVLVAAALPAAAQNNAFTAYGGYGFGGTFENANNSAQSATLDSAFTGALALDWAIDPARQVQLFASYQSTELPAFAAGMPAVPMSMTYLHIGGTNFFDGGIGRGLYVVGGIGATWMSPSLSGTSGELRPSMNLGIGYQWPLAPNVALRFEVRGLFTLVNSNGGLFCSGGCVVAISGDLLTQGQALVGLSVGF